jgi:hypothetical protein
LFADLLIVAVVGGLLVAPLRRAAQAVRIVQSGARGDRRRFAIRAAAVACFAAAIMFWPWPYRVGAPAVVRLRDAEYVYVVAGGELTESVELGATVEPGAQLAQLDDPQLRLDVIRLEADVARRRLDVANLERRRVADPSQGDALPAARELLAAAERQLRHRREEQDRLRIVASRPGTVLPIFAAEPAAENGSPISPLDPRRRGAYLSPGTPLCAVGDPTRWECEVTVDQHEIEFVREGQSVALRFDALPGRTFTGRVVEIAEVEIDAALAEVNSTAPADGDAESEQNAMSKIRYSVRVVPDDALADLPVGAVGRAKIDAAPQSLWTRLRRTLETTFRFVGRST